MLENFEQLEKNRKVVRSELAKHTESHDQLKSSFQKHLAICTPLTLYDNVCDTNPCFHKASLIE